MSGGTQFPTDTPSSSPTWSPYDSPSFSPSRVPSSSPTLNPSRSPTFSPRNSPSSSPSDSPSNSPSKSPQNAPTSSPSLSPRNGPSSSPSNSPTHAPWNSPSHSPRELPTNSPSISPLVKTLTKIRLTVTLKNIPSSTDVNILSDDLLKGVKDSIDDGTDVNDDDYELTVDTVDSEGAVLEIECTEATVCQDILDYLGSDTGKQSTGDEITEVCLPSPFSRRPFPPLLASPNAKQNTHTNRFSSVNTAATAGQEEVFRK